MRLTQGLKYIDDFVSAAEAKAFIEFIDTQTWDTSLSRRVQEVTALCGSTRSGVVDLRAWRGFVLVCWSQYGFTYHTQPRGEYASEDGKKLPVGSATSPIPKQFDALCKRLVERKLMSRAPDQMIINEYHPGKGNGYSGRCILPLLTACSACTCV
jgi:hypothetical protein